MITFVNQTIGIDQGERSLFSDFEEEGAMWTGEGPRERRSPVRFSKPFKTVPAVHVSLSMWDFDSARNARADLSAENVTPEGFEAVFRTWGDTRIARARMRWMAIGPVPHADDWDLY